MKTTSLASLAVLTCSVIGFAAPDESGLGTRQLQVYPKNLARQHLGSNLFHFNQANQSYVPTEAAAAWLDDDITTGWPVMAGKQHYLLTLSEPQLLTNFSISTRPASGAVTIYVSDEPAPPGAKAWTAVARDVPIEQINQRKLDKSFSRFGKYVLIETDVADPGPLFSLYLYGSQPAVSYSIRERGQAIDTRSIFGPYVNNQTAFSTAGLYAQSRVTYANSPDGFLSWQRAVDDNPESSLTISPSAQEASAVVSYRTARSVSRVAVLTDSPAKGRLDFYVVDRSGSATAALAEDEAEITPVSLPRGAAELSPTGPVAVEGLTPAGSIILDGTNARASVDFAPADGDQLLVRWVPDSAGESLTVRELNTFNELSLANTELSLRPEMIADLGDGPGRRSRDLSKDGKSFVSHKDFKEPIAALDNPPPVAAFEKSPYLPGALGFPPIITGRPGVLESPEPLSP